MKKTVTALLIGLAATSYGIVNINWLATTGFYFSASPSIGILGDGTGNSTFAQLIYSLDGNVDAATVGGGVSGDDVVWATKNLTEDGITNDGTQFDSFAWFMLPNNYQQAFVAGNVYARIFQDGNVGAGDWYFFSSMTGLIDTSEVGQPQTIEMNTDMVNGNAIDSGLTVAQVIPEPATAMLLAIGGGIAWLIRLKQRLI